MKKVWSAMMQKHRGAIPRPSTRRSHVLMAFFLVISLLLTSPAAAGSMLSFVHTASADNISGFLTEIDHPFLNDNPNARVFVTQAWNFVLGQGSQNDRAIGVRYDVDFSGNGRWSVFNQKTIFDMEPGLIFHVMVAGDDSASFLHVTNHDNITNIASFVHCPAEFDYFCFGGAADILHSHTLDAWGLRGAKFVTPTSAITSFINLTIRAESTDPADYPNMRPGALFWILAGGEEFGGEQSFTHAATAANIFDWLTKLDDPQLNGNPGAVLFVSRSGPAGPSMEEHIGVVYANDGINDVWSVMNQTTTPVTEGARFSVFIPPILADGFESGDLSWWP